MCKGLISNSDISIQHLDLGMVETQEKFSFDQSEHKAKYKISVFRVMGLKILGSVGTHIFLKKKNSGKNIILCILKGIKPFKMH